ncbi:unnamed protein product [Mucor hiemalis]
MMPIEYDQLADYYGACFGDDTYFSENDTIPPGRSMNTYSIVKNQIATFKSVKLLGQQYNSSRTTTKRGNVILAYFKDSNIRFIACFRERLEKIILFIRSSRSSFFNLT